MKPFVLMLIGVLFAGLACALPAQTGSGDAQPAPDVLFQDDFSDQLSNSWDTGSDDQSSQSIDNGVFEIKVHAPQVLVWSGAGQDVDDIRIDVDAEKIDGPEDAEYGLICRYTKDESGNFSFYYLVIAGDTHAKIAKVINSGQDAVSIANIRFEEVDSGNAANHITAECIGNQLTLYVNNSEILVVADDDLVTGDVGLIASTYVEGEMDVRFDNFVVTER